MSFYASVMKGVQGAPVIGPFRRHGDALRAANALADFVRQSEDPDRHWYAVGTCRHRTGHEPGRYNHYLSLTVGIDGYVDPATVPEAQARPYLRATRRGLRYRKARR